MDIPTNTIFDKINVRPVINGCGIYTDLGGSVLSPHVWSAMQEMNSSFVRMVDLLNASGVCIARLLGAEAARVTSGAAAAIVLGTAACMAGMDGMKWEQLPNSEDTRDEVLIQRLHRYKYDRCARVAGAKVIDVGDETGTSTRQLVER